MLHFFSDPHQYVPYLTYFSILVLLSFCPCNIWSLVFLHLYILTQSWSYPVVWIIVKVILIFKKVIQIVDLWCIICKYLMCSEKESPNELWVCYLVFVQSRNLSDEWLSFCLYMFIHVYLLLCLCIVYFIDLTF